MFKCTTFEYRFGCKVLVEYYSELLSMKKQQQLNLKEQFVPKVSEGKLKLSMQFQKRIPSRNSGFRAAVNTQMLHENKNESKIRHCDQIQACRKQLRSQCLTFEASILTRMVISKFSCDQKKSLKEIPTPKLS